MDSPALDASCNHTTLCSLLKTACPRSPFDALEEVKMPVSKIQRAHLERLTCRSTNQFCTLNALHAHRFEQRNQKEIHRANHTAVGTREASTTVSGRSASFRLLPSGQASGCVARQHADLTVIVPEGRGGHAGRKKHLVSRMLVEEKAKRQGSGRLKEWMAAYPR